MNIDKLRSGLRAQGVQVSQTTQRQPISEKQQEQLSEAFEKLADFFSDSEDNHSTQNENNF